MDLIHKNKRLDDCNTFRFKTAASILRHALASVTNVKLTRQMIYVWG